MKSLVAQRCFHHAEREAAARCPECGRTYCRECVSDHDGRVICAACLARLAGQKMKKSPAATVLVALVPAAAAFLFLWFAVYLLGYGLSAIPSNFHEGTIWRDLTRSP